MGSEGLNTIWESSRHNDWSYALPLVLNIGTAVLIMFAFVPLKWLRWVLNVFAVLAMGYFAIEYSSMEIEEKWRIRSEWIKTNIDSLTDKERSAGTVDGANRVLGPILIGGQSAVFRAGIVLIGSAFARIVLVRIRKTQPKKNVSKLTLPQNQVDSIAAAANPYVHPNTLAPSPQDTVE